ncbi:hypothetical protein [Vibrio celticus]|uniref:hypothetical protein n=1 Tax=Vibrio celticus TaxID=446372 RepID=UPI00406898A0
MHYSSKTISLFNALNNEKILYCHWKSTDHLEASYLAKTDLDVLISFEDSESASSLAIQQGFIRMETVNYRGYPGVQDFIAFDAELNRWVHLHFHIQLMCGDRWVKSFRLPFEREILAKRVYCSKYDTYTIAPQDEFIICILRMVMKLKKPFQDKKVLKELDYLRNKVLDSKNVVLVGNTEYPENVLLLATNILNSSYQVSEHDHSEIKKYTNELRWMKYSEFILLNVARYTLRLGAEFLRRKLNIYKFGRRKIYKGGSAVLLKNFSKQEISQLNSIFAKQFNLETISYESILSNDFFKTKEYKRLYISVSKRNLVFLNLGLDKDDVTGTTSLENLLASRFNGLIIDRNELTDDPVFTAVHKTEERISK